MNADFERTLNVGDSPPADVDRKAAGDVRREFDRWTAVGVVERDRYCQHCGYNLITQPVRREPRLDVLIVRCPECGRFESVADVHARRLWLSRLLKVALLGWIALALLSLAAACGLMMAPVFVVIDESLTWYQQAGQPPRWMRVIRTPEQEVVALAIAASALAGFAFVSAATVLVYHWRRWAYLLLALVPPTIAATIVSTVWLQETPKLWPFVWEHVWLHWRVQLAAGILGAVAGRASARLLARLLIPASLRSALAFLWLVDRLPPPQRVRSGEFSPDPAP